MRLLLTVLIAVVQVICWELPLSETQHLPGQLFDLGTSKVTPDARANKETRQTAGLADTGISRPRNRCAYGSLPGVWVSNRWTILSEGCQLRDLLTPHLTTARKYAAESTVAHRQFSVLENGNLDRAAGVFAGTVRAHLQQSHVKVLLFGDSVDRDLVADTCSAAHWPERPFTIRGTGECYWDKMIKIPDNQSCTYRCFCNTCDLPTITLSKEAIWSVRPTGTYFKNRTGSPAVRITKAMELFAGETGGLPDIIMLSSNFWDISRLTQLQPELAFVEDLPVHILKQWMADATAIFLLLRKLAPAATLIYHTTAFPQMRNCSEGGRLVWDQLGQKAHVEQLNAAGRTVAEQLGVALIDLEAMTRKFGRPEYYLKDTHHPSGLILREVLNIALNLRAEVSQGAAKPAQQLRRCTRDLCHPVR